MLVGLVGQSEAIPPIQLKIYLKKIVVTKGKVRIKMINTRQGGRDGE